MIAVMLTSNNGEVGDIQRGMRLYLRSCAFATCACNKNTEEHAPTQKTPSEKKCSQLFVRISLLVRVDTVEHAAVTLRGTSNIARKPYIGRMHNLNL